MRVTLAIYIAGAAIAVGILGPGTHQGTTFRGGKCPRYSLGNKGTPCARTCQYRSGRRLGGSRRYCSVSAVRLGQDRLRCVLESGIERL
jgi:hypothetical protein